MSNKIGILTVTFNENKLLEANIKQFKGLDLFHTIVCSGVAWHGDEKWDRKIPSNLNINNNFVFGAYRSDAEQRNAGLEFMQRHGIQWTLVVDTDEFWERKELIRLFREIEKNKNFVDVFTAPKMHVYWKDMNTRIYPDPQPDNPVVAMRTNQRFRWSRLVDAERRKETHADFHHLSYVRTDEQMKRKMSGSEHAHELIPNWYEDVWLNSKPWSTNLHPVVPHQFAYTVENPVPDEIKELF